MSANKAEASLERLVSSLARQSEGDIEDVLMRLDPDERQALRPILTKYGVAPPVADPRPAPPQCKEETKPELAAPAGLSPWLAQRIAGAGAQNTDRDPIRMTPLAHETLRAVAVEKIDEPKEPRSPSRWRLFGKRMDANQADERS